MTDPNYPAPTRASQNYLNQAQQPTGAAYSQAPRQTVSQQPAVTSDQTADYLKALVEEQEKTNKLLTTIKDQMSPVVVMACTVLTAFAGVLLYLMVQMSS